MLRECPMKPYAADPSGGCGVPVSDSGREHGFGAPPLPALRFVRTARGSERLRPRLKRHAPRLGGIIDPGGVPGRRAVTRTRATAASPFDLSEPASGSEWPVVPGAGRLPAKHRDDRDSGTGLRLAAPTSASADHATGGRSVVAAPYHPVTRASRAFLLSRSLQPLARRPILAPVTPRFAPIRIRNACRAVTGAMRFRRPRAPAGRATRSALTGRVLRRGPRCSEGCTPSAPSVGGEAGAAERHAQEFGPELAQPAAWAELGIVVLATCVRAAGIDRAGVFGWLGGAQIPPQSDPQSTRFEPYRIRAAPRKRPTP